MVFGFNAMAALSRFTVTQVHQFEINPWPIGSYGVDQSLNINQLGGVPDFDILVLKMAPKPGYSSHGNHPHFAILCFENIFDNID